MIAIEVLGIDGNELPVSVALKVDSGIAVVCRYVNGEWEPVYGITEDGAQKSLPHCFSLSIAALKQLDGLRDELPA